MTPWGVVSLDPIICLWELMTLGVANWTPGAWLTEFMQKIIKHCYIRGMFEMNCLLSSSSISTWGTIKTNTYLYRAIQYQHNGI